MIIHHLKVSGFRIMGETVDVSFPSEGRIGILGQNESGKTTLFQAIECALYGLKKGSGPEADRENLVTWGKNEAKLEIEFTSGQNRYNLQRIFKSRNIHRANLTQVINGVRDRSSSITGLSDVEGRIELITGMDRDSFTKLVYIKQKDLDALKELAKSKREQLVNKVMGIELFDDAANNVKTDISDHNDKLKTADLQLKLVRKNKEEYESKITQKSVLEAKTAEEKPKLEAKKGELENAKKLLDKYDWISSYKSATDLEGSLKNEAGQIEKELQKVSQLQGQTEKIRNALKTYKPEIIMLQDHIQKLSTVETRLNENEDSQGALQIKKQEATAKLGLTDNDLKLLSQDLPSQKKRQLTLFGAALITGLACLALAFLNTIFFIGGAAALLALSAYSFIKYLKIDKLAAQNIEIQAINSQIKDIENKALELQTEKTELSSQSTYKTAEQAQNHLNTVLDQMKKVTGEGSVEGAEAVLRTTSEELSKLRQTNPQTRKETLESQIQKTQTEIQKLVETKPAGIDEIQYSKEQHDSLKKQRETIQAAYESIKQTLDSDQGTIKQLEKDLTTLKPDFDQYPQLETEVQNLQEKIQLLTLVNSQLSETSKELRNKVLPHARLIINQILPTLTSDRYSDFEITEDLKFKVHAREAGGYKEREIFSGGTQDQFLIALRLAFTQSILDSRVMADKYSLLMDECTSSSDEIRKQGIFEVLDALKQTFSQILIIAHEDIATYVDNYLVLERNDHGYTEIKSKSWIQ